MKKIVFLDRMKKEVLQEKVYGQASIELFYGEGIVSRCFFWGLLPWLVAYPFFSKFYGFIQKSRWTKKKIRPFIQEFQVDTTEFLDPVSSFSSFNDFFIRKLKLDTRPLASGRDVAVLPADGRYLVYPDISQADGFVVKGKKFCLEQLLQDKELAALYAKGSLVIARLCPTDYHRFHFPMNCIPSQPIPIKGGLHSVNPMALRKRIEIFSENKRELTVLQTQNFGQVLFMEIGALCVGAIHQTFVPKESYAKGDEKGYFSFGGSSLLVLFEPGRIQFDQDLVDASQNKLEVRGLMGQSLGRSLTP